MIIRALFFGHYRDIVPSGELALSLPDSATIADAAAALATTDLRLADILSRTRVAIGADFATPETPLKDGDELAFLPPMSGG
ncbi:MoaD/ThiS family protein [Armatimonas sp.]|uniref:MoaD/ThiS family protein n=1 Tax=Armatimonas sp. TaxID=1872638 RepID=UPI003750902A